MTAILDPLDLLQTLWESSRLPESDSAAAQWLSGPTACVPVPEQVHLLHPPWSIPGPCQELGNCIAAQTTLRLSGYAVISFWDHN